MEEKVIVVASTNAGKIREFKEMLEPEGYTVKSLADYPDIGEIEENGTTFEENAIIKAKAVTDRYGIMAISDDSGLSIDAFDGGPGIHSARFLGHDTSYDYKNRVILGSSFLDGHESAHRACAARTIVAQKEADGEGKFQQKNKFHFSQNTQKGAFLALCAAHCPSYRPNRSSSFSQKVSGRAGAWSAWAALSRAMGAVCRANCRAETPVF